MRNIRFIHNIKDAPKLNIYNNESALVLNLEYQQVTNYLLVKPEANLSIKTIDKNVTIDKFDLNNIEISDYYTIIIIGDITDISTIRSIWYVDDMELPYYGYANLTFSHAVFGAPPVDVYINNKLLLKDIKFDNVVTIPLKIHGETSIYINAAGSDTNVIKRISFRYISGGIYTLVVSGTLKHGLSFININDNYGKITDEYQKNFNVQKYMGNWYQIASIPQFYEPGCVKEVAQYTLLNDRINVHNICYNKNNESKSITGYATINSQNAAELTVIFPIMNQQLNYPNYIIHKTDYIDYAIIGSPLRSSFYILSRYEIMDKKEYTYFINYAKKLGYNTKLIVKTC
jgi:apolipoprotein D and lipocalin family protein